MFPCSQSRPLVFPPSWHLHLHLRLHFSFFLSLFALAVALWLCFFGLARVFSAFSMNHTTTERAFQRAQRVELARRKCSLLIFLLVTIPHVLLLFSFPFWHVSSGNE